jgi:hypothetical protein
MNRALPSRWTGDVLPVALVLPAAVLFGVVVVKSPLGAALLLGVFAVAIATARYGVFTLTAASFALLPWLVLFEGALPNEVGTMAAAAGTVCLLTMVWPLEFDSKVIPIGAFFFIAVTLGHAMFADNREQWVQVAKYMVFATIALSTTSIGGQRIMPRFKIPVYGSCLAAMVVQIGIIGLGLGSGESYYEAGESLGFAGAPHALALMTMIVAVAGLNANRNVLKVAFFGLGAIPAAYSGVRSALLGLVVGLIAFLVTSKAKLQAIAVIAVLAAVALATGSLDVVLNRFASHPNEFSSFSSAGSGRGLIWTIALDAWNAAGPVAWVFGTGLRSITGFELAVLGKELVGHSDIVEVLVQFGVVGFAAWLTIWYGLIRSSSSSIILLSILTFGAVNGSLEYVGSLTAGIVLAGIFAARSADAEAPDLSSA